MYFNTKTGQVLHGHSEIRAALSHVMFLETITEQDLATHGVFPVAAVAAPAPALDTVAVEGPPEKVNGQWWQTWTTRAATPDELAAKTAELTKFYDGVVQGHIDGVAQSFGYGDPNRPEVSPILHAITYAEEPAVARFQNEGKALRAWRSLVWAAAGGLLLEVVGGVRPLPTPAELLALLPAPPVQEPYI